MTDDDGLRQRIVEVAAELFAENGYGGTTVRMVAERTGVTRRTVKQLTGSRAQLFALVLATRPPSQTAAAVAAAAADPGAAPRRTPLRPRGANARDCRRAAAGRGRLPRREGWLRAACS